MFASQKPEKWKFCRCFLAFHTWIKLQVALTKNSESFFFFQTKSRSVTLMKWTAFGSCTTFVEKALFQLDILDILFLCFFFFFLKSNEQKEKYGRFESGKKNSNQKSLRRSLAFDHFDSIFNSNRTQRTLLFFLSVRLQVVDVM